MLGFNLTRKLIMHCIHVSLIIIPPNVNSELSCCGVDQITSSFGYREWLTILGYIIIIIPLFIFLLPLTILFSAPHSHFIIIKRVRKRIQKMQKKVTLITSLKLEGRQSRSVCDLSGQPPFNASSF